MLAFLICLFAATDISQDFQSQFQSIDCNRCIGYVTQSPLFKVSFHRKEAQRERYHCHCFFDPKKTTCLIITNSTEGVSEFFKALMDSALGSWIQVTKDEETNKKTFFGYSSSDGKTLALIGQYTELTELPNPVPTEHLRESVDGQLYLKVQERQAQDMEILQALRDNTRKAGFTYPAAGIPYPGSNLASAQW